MYIRNNTGPDSKLSPVNIETLLEQAKFYGLDVPRPQAQPTPLQVIPEKPAQPSPPQPIPGKVSQPTPRGPQGPSPVANRPPVAERPNAPSAGTPRPTPQQAQAALNKEIDERR